MGAPSGCSVSVPEILLAGLSGGLISAVPLARQPAPEGAISKSSWPTVWPSSLMVSLPLSCAKRVELFFCAARVRAAQASIARAAAATVFLSFMERLTPCPFSLRREVSQRGDAIRFRRKQQCRGGEFPRRLGRVRRNRQRDSRRVDRKADAARRARGSWIHREKAGARSWSCNARGGRREGSPARGRAHAKHGEIRGSRAARRFRRRGRGRCLL